MRFQTVDLESFQTIVGSLINSSPGHNEIHISILKENFHFPGPGMLQICNKSQEQGIFPNSVKKNIFPIFNAGGQEKSK